MPFTKNILILLLIVGFVSCKESSDSLFVKIPSEDSGISFSNDLIINDSLNAAVFEYIYNGAGVAVADFNKDGLMDLFFTGNQVSSKLYLNDGEFKFSDITESAGLITNKWCTGVTIVDINQDGYPDIYVSVAGFETADMENLLFINQGDLTFTEEARAYGLNDNRYGTQSAFFDYDRDGDLDVYILNNALEEYNRGKLKEKVIDGTAASNDQLYRNEGNGTFSNVTLEAGILKEGWGLGLSVTDINLDGWPDIYVSNDFLSNDLMYINQQDGTFSDEINQYLKHQTLNGMGNDVADYNNDGLVDIIVLDMLPEDNYREKMMLLPASYNQFQISLDYGYQPQYVRNTLQLNNGNGSFSEIGQLAGIARTDWSWSSLFADFNNDGWKDLFITNGYRQDVTNLDYIAYTQKVATFGTQEAKKRDIIREMQELEGVQLHNYIYENQQDLTFEDRTEDWGLEEETFSNGAVYVDLDNDGDLDLVVNNIDQAASVYRNTSLDANTEGHFISVDLQGPSGNLDGIGAKVWLETASGTQFQEKSLVRGYKSSVDPRLFFGLKANDTPRRLIVEWPDAKQTVINNPSLDAFIKLVYDKVPLNEDTLRITQTTIQEDEQPLFSRKNKTLEYVHEEDDYPDFNNQVMLPRKFSQEGPPAVTGDLNGDGLDDLFIGGSLGKAGVIFFQTEEGTFTKVIFSPSIPYHDSGVALLDADNDGDMDIFISSGGNQLPLGDERYRNRLYLNDGEGKFSENSMFLFTETENSSIVRAADIDNDGDQDLFVGGSIVPAKYPEAEHSYLLINENGQFNRREIPGENGIINDAHWRDLDNDGYVDLVLAQEWAPIRILINASGDFTEKTSEAGTGSYSGWWQRIITGDFDQDGDMDIVAGNMGDNHLYNVSADTPLRLLVSDFDENGTADPVMTYFNQGKEVVKVPRDQLINQIPAIKKRFPKYEEFARASLEETFIPEELEAAIVLEATSFSNMFFENMGDGTFKGSKLPVRAQFAPILGALEMDTDQDGLPDLLFAGNSHSAEIHHGWFDASPGGVLRGNGKGEFRFIPVMESGFVVDGNVKSLHRIKTRSGAELIIAIQNRDSIIVHEWNRVGLTDTSNIDL